MSFPHDSESHSFSRKEKKQKKKIVRNAEGQSRLFGFVGFATHSEARDALEHWNGAYLDTSKLRVEWARAVGDEGLPRAWSKYTKQKEEKARANEVESEPVVQVVAAPRSKGKGPVDEEEREKKFQEFLALAKRDKSAHEWKNDDVSGNKRAGGGGGGGGEQGEEEMDDLAWLRSKMVAEAADADGIVGGGDADEDNNASLVTKDSSTPDTAKIAETCRLLVRNLAAQCEEGDIRSVFERYGALEELTLVPGKCFAFVRYANPAHALNAYGALDGTILLGRLIHVVAADAKRGDGEERQFQEASTSSFKREQQAKKRKTAAMNDSGDIFSAIYVDSNAAATVMAQAMGVKKGDLLGAERSAKGASVAVTAALAETMVVGDIRKWLEENGVNVSGRNVEKEKSATTFLVKNLPANTTEMQVEELFVEHGDLLRVLVVPGGTMAIVEYANATQASRAYRNMCFYNFKGTPLYLQWAPLNVFSKEASSTRAKQKASAAAVAPTTTPSSTAAAAPEAALHLRDADEDDDESKSIFVKNLNFATTQAQLQEQFPGCRSATIVMKLGKSLGYGFVEFSTSQDALKAIKLKQGVQLDGHALQLALSRKPGAGQPEVEAAKKKIKEQKKKRAEPEQDECPKLLIKNIPFEASKQELQTLFSSYATLKSMRLPLKFDRSHRGFCFAEFQSKAEARKVKEALSSTHLYGRHLVIEYAKAEDDVEDTRAKTKQKFDKQ